MDKVAIIIPVYNAEEFLKYSVESVLNQTYSNLEIILVNDGSKDSSGLLCDEYAEKDSRVKVIHKENGGLSCARNTGVENATADWIIFLDSDDYYEKITVEYLVKLRDKFNADMAATTVVEVRSYDVKDTLESVNLEEASVLNRETALEEMFYGNIVGTHVGGKLYKREVLEKCPFPKGMLYEDLACSYEHINICEKIAIGKHNLYKYYRRPGSIVNSKFNPKILDFFKAMDCNFNYIKRDFPNNSNMRKAVNSRYVLNGLHVVNAMLKSNMTKDLKKQRKNFSKYWKDVLKNPRVIAKNKVKYGLFIMSPKIYDIVRTKYLKD